MPSRRTHHKSRYGCINCKHRRVKCDELRPKCSNCLRRDSECEYGSPASLRWIHGAAFRRQSTRDDATSGQRSRSVTMERSGLMLPERCTGLDDSAVPPPLNLVDLELLMHWKDSTYQIFCRNPHTHSIWQSLVPREALKEPFLMHGILALSAVHLAQTKCVNLRPTTYIGIAVSHQNQALAAFRSSLKNINESNSVAMFAFASIATIHSFAFPQEPGSPGPRSTLDDVCQVIVFAQGVHQIAISAAEYLQNSIFKPLLQWDDLDQILTDDARLSFENLREALYALDTESTRHAYLKAVDSTQDSLAEILGGFNGVAAATRVAIRMPSIYVALLRTYDPLALVILCHYCAVLHRLRHNWCLEDRGARVARAVWFTIGDEWRHLMHWPMQDIFGPDFLAGLDESSRRLRYMYCVVLNTYSYDGNK
ncbi:C6 zinc finger domain protein [Aspergillus tamarii]|uniref:C6 zinc finger domain protein n=1 Tax=Aspergillus tamarii TaxID=41984 RepID=A0A5N6VCA9_ASPTM|nr:C6 zinc finger domain protein [Aspergillus tamarii]